jgi:CubicO group peptidase (beta-lactamase class C family)
MMDRRSVLAGGSLLAAGGWRMGRAGEAAMGLDGTAGFWEAGGWGYGMQVVTDPQPGYPRGCGCVGGYGTSGYRDAASGLIGIHLTQRVMESPAPTAVFTDFWTGARAAVGV